MTHVMAETASRPAPAAGTAVAAGTKAVFVAFHVEGVEAVVVVVVVVTDVLEELVHAHGWFRYIELVDLRYIVDMSFASPAGRSSAGAADWLALRFGERRGCSRPPPRSGPLHFVHARPGARVNGGAGPKGGGRKPGVIDEVIRGTTTREVRRIFVPGRKSVANPGNARCTAWPSQPIAASGRRKSGALPRA